jgi:hypothetical protein
MSSKGEALKVAATATPLLAFVWVWATYLIRTPHIRWVSITGGLTMITLAYLAIALRYWT